MKTIFRYTSIGLLTLAIFAVGAMATFAQDACADVAGQTSANEKIQELYKNRTIPGRKAYLAEGKAFLEKYGACETAKDLSDYLKGAVPKEEENIKKMEDAVAREALLKRFDTGLDAKNWDEVFAAGKEILQKWPDEFRAVELVLGSIGLDETAKTPSVTKWNDDTLRFAKLAISSLEGGKTFKPAYGVKTFTYKDKEDALGWMNYTVGYILYYDKKDKKQALSHLYKATQGTSTTKSVPAIYQAIGAYYFDEVKRLALEVTELEKKQNPENTPEVQKAVVDEIKAKIALVNGTAEAAIDAYARALTVAKTDATRYPKTYQDGLTKTMQDLYNVRFGKMDGFDTSIANTTKKPMPNPTSPVTPIADPEVTTTTTSTTPATSTKPPTAPAKAAVVAVKPGAVKN